MKPPAFSFRNLPFSIYLAVGLGFVGSVTFTIAYLMASGEGYERYQGAERARIFNLGCQYAQIFLYSCGLFALARRHTGPARTLAQVAAWLMFIGLSGPFVNLMISIVEPREIREVYDAIGLLELFVMIAASILLTIAADAWRRVLPAAIVLVLLHVTSYSFPVIGSVINDVMKGDHNLIRIYYVFREAAWAVTLLFIASALAAGGRDLPSEPRRAASGFQIAHTSLIVRLVAAITMALMGFAAQSPGIAKLVIVGGPLVIIGTQVAFAVGILRVDSANLPGMPRLLLAISAAGLFWFASLQLEQVTFILAQLWDGQFDADDFDHLKLFSVVGPIVVTIALTMVGLAVVGFATSRGNFQLATSARSRTYAFVALTLGAVALQAFMLESRSLGSAVVVGLLAAAAGIAGLVLLSGLLKSAAEQVDAEPGLPPARVVSDS